MKSFEHFKEGIISQFMRLKKDLNDEHNIVIKKIDEYVIMIDNCDNEKDIHMVAVKSLRDLDDRIEGRKERFK